MTYERERLCKTCQNFFIPAPARDNRICPDCMRVARRRRALAEAEEFVEIHEELHNIVKRTRMGQLRYPPPYERRGPGLAAQINARVATRSRKEIYGEEF